MAITLAGPRGREIFASAVMSDAMPPAAQDFWRGYLAGTGRAPGPVHSAMAGSPAQADELLSLYLSGKKTAGSSLLRDYIFAGEQLPKAGDYWVVLDRRGVPGCILRTEAIEIHLFRDITPYIASAEGEGDRTLEGWRSAHEAAFAPHIERLMIGNLDSAEVITEFFSHVWPVPSAGPAGNSFRAA